MIRQTLKVGIVTVSDRCSAGKRKDESGGFLKKRTAEAGWLLVSYRVIPDEEKVIRNTLIWLADKERVDLILTTGGTGLAKRDVTPEATRKVIEKEIPGISETMRMKSSDKSPYAVLSRGISGFRKNTLVVNLPGSPEGVKECLEIILPVIPHALEIMKGGKAHHHHKKNKL